LSRLNIAVKGNNDIFCKTICSPCDDFAIHIDIGCDVPESLSIPLEKAYFKTWPDQVDSSEVEADVD